MFSDGRRHASTAPLRKGLCRLLRAFEALPGDIALSALRTEDFLDHAATNANALMGPDAGPKLRISLCASRQEPWLVSRSQNTNTAWSMLHLDNLAMAIVTLSLIRGWMGSNSRLIQKLFCYEMLRDALRIHAM